MDIYLSLPEGEAFVSKSSSAAGVTIPPFLPPPPRQFHLESTQRMNGNSSLTQVLRVVPSDIVDSLVFSL